MELIAPLIGWLYLWIRYRNKNKVNQILTKEYEDSYDFVGRYLLAQSVTVLLLLVLIAFLFVVISVVIRDL